MPWQFFQFPFLFNPGEIMHDQEETIAAIATGMTNAGISVIRISGPDVLEVVERIFVPRNSEFNIRDFKTYTAHYGVIVDKSGEEIDEGIILYMKGPHSYTGEDVAEVSVHGGTYVAEKVLERILECGVRTAGPGEFSKRAFLNGRMDLTRAEAVMDVIEADNEDYLHNSVRLLKGDLYQKIVNFRSDIIRENAYIEYALDDPENVSLDGFDEHLTSVLKPVYDELGKLIDSSEEGRLSKDGINTVIVGSPNVGKSSLLNRLLRQERAIVTDIPGTTRDTLEERCLVDGIPLNIIDTAGIRQTSDKVEQIGVQKARESLDRADLVLLVLDGSKPVSQDELDIQAGIGDRPEIIIINKTDISDDADISELMKLCGDRTETVRASMKNGSGMDELKRAIRDLFFSGQVNDSSRLRIYNTRQVNELKNARNSLEKVFESQRLGVGEDFYTIDLMDAYQALGRIIGQETGDDLINEIFDRFCIGK